MPEVPARAGVAALAGRTGRRAVARPGNRRAAEIQRALLQIGHHLDHVRVEQRGHRFERRRQRRDVGARERPSRCRDLIDQASGISGSSPCTLTTISPSPQRSRARPRRRGRCPRRARRPSCRTSAPKPRARLRDALIVGGDDDLLRAASGARARTPTGSSACRRAAAAACRAVASRRSAPESRPRGTSNELA